MHQQHGWVGLEAVHLGTQHPRLRADGGKGCSSHDGRGGGRLVPCVPCALSGKLGGQSRQLGAVARQDIHIQARAR